MSNEIIRMAYIGYSVATFYGNGVNSHDAAKKALKQIHAAKGVLGKLKPDAKPKFMIFDYAPYDRISWDNGTFYGEVEGKETVTIQPIEYVTLDTKGNLVDHEFLETRAST